MASPAFALVGSESLLGREIRDLASTTRPELQLRLIAADEEQPGRLTRLGDEPAVVEYLQADSLAGVRGVFLAGSAASALKALELAEDGAEIIDLVGSSEDRPEARLRAPMIESEIESDGEATEGSSTIHVVAHPAAIALALLLRRLHAHDPIRRSVAQIFVPASEHGTAGVTELQHQTISLLSFKPLPQAIFDTQSAFNLLARYGEEAPVKLEESELRIERHLASLLSLPGDGEDAPMPSLRVIQAPVFHGYSFSVWVEFEDEPELESLEGNLAAGHLEVRSAEFEPPTNVGQAGQSGIAVGGITPDRNHAQACWFWMVADNLRLAAENAVEIARRMI